MANLYLVELDIEYKGKDYNEFLKVWLEDVSYYLEKQNEGKVKQSWKAAGERKVFIVIEQCSNDMDKMMFDSPLMKTLGDQVRVTVTELMKYENFTNNLNEMISSDTRYEYKEPVKKEGMFYWLEFNIGYSGHSFKDFLRIWSEEAAFGMVAKTYGIAIDLWKCVGMNRVHVLANFENAEALDKTVLSLPLMKQNGDNTELKVKPVISFDEFGKHLKSIVTSSEA